MSEDMIAKRYPGGTVFNDNGGSHVNFDPNGTHVTVPIGGLKQGGGVSVHIPIDQDGNIQQPTFDYRPENMPLNR